MPQKIELKPCQKCGQKPVVRYDRSWNHYFAMCRRCLIAGAVAETRDEAALYWNEECEHEAD